MTKIHFTELPQSLVDAVRNERNLLIEDNAILFFVDQGYGAFATVTINHWLGLRDGSLVLEVNISQRPSASSGDWMGCDKFALSEPMTEAQALQVVDYWKRIASAAERVASDLERQERERFDAFGPRTARPWEIEAEPSASSPQAQEDQGAG